ncbi:MAG: hypothetical protein M0R06_12945 [Sphaerochaeta sp.]|jgi:hypothetical protein|uniref:cell division protein FtsQ/DivIB n=1 Tax=Sphaerochaeta sp. TaxID=1972642 RepID=UPI002604AB6B|nr:hypothetical protein [Sphaerochaeta sp.]MCK9599944.1 hypothetical protein [Sphaerochaeta sp.]MDX9823433.1 hypothetical protein [Sphaerochaeta sp.]
MKPVAIKVKLTLLILVFAIILGLLLLQSIPAFNLRTVQITVEGGSGEVPVEAKQQLASLVGVSLFSINMMKQKRALTDITGIQKADLRRKPPSTLQATVHLFDASAVIREEDGGQAYLVEDHHLRKLHPDDVSAWQKVVVTIEVPASYAHMMATYSVDDSFLHVMQLATSLEGKTTLITKIKYDNNSSNSFGKMVLELSSLNAQIWVREPVGAPQIHAAVSLVLQDQKDSLSFLSSEARRYDLYREGLVRRW